jgi:hypothetical protein
MAAECCVKLIRTTVQRCFELAYGRRATAAEAERCVRHWRDMVEVQREAVPCSSLRFRLVMYCERPLRRTLGSDSVYGDAVWDGEFCAGFAGRGLSR